MFGPKRSEQRLYRAFLRGGPPEFNEFIFCENAAGEAESTVYFHVTHNLHAALLALRSAVETLMLWIDQICINSRQRGEIFLGAAYEAYLSKR